MMMEMNKLINNKEDINAAGHFSHPVLRPMLVRMLPFARKLKDKIVTFNIICIQVSTHL
jgi:hypothetical protein